MKEFAAKKSEKLGKLFKERGALDLEQNKRQPGTNPYSNSRLPNGSSTEVFFNKNNAIHHKSTVDFVNFVEFLIHSSLDK